MALHVIDPHFTMKPNWQQRSQFSRTYKAHAAARVRANAFAFHHEPFALVDKQSQAIDLLRRSARIPPYFTIAEHVIVSILYNKSTRSQYSMEELRMYEAFGSSLCSQTGYTGRSILKNIRGACSGTSLRKCFRLSP